MKHLYLLLFLLLLTPLLGIAQDVTITRDQDSGYFLIVDTDSLILPDTTYMMGDTLSLDGQDKYNFEYTALRAGLGLMARYDLIQGDIKVIGGNRFTIGTDLWYMDDPTVITDTVYVPTDTVTVTETIYEERVDTVYTTEVVTDTVYVQEGVERPLVEAFRNQIEYLDQDSLTVIHSYMYTAADSLHIQFDCDTQREPLHRIKYTSSFHDGHEVIYDAIGTQCDTDLELEYLFFAEGDTAEVREDLYPLWSIIGDTTSTGFSTSFVNEDILSWTNTWGTLNHSIESGTLIVDLLERNIARLQWDRIPEHRNIRYTIQETLHASHSTGAHIGGRHSPSDTLKHSVETYINNNGLGISIFSDDVWSNPHNFPFQWESGDIVSYRVEIIDDTIRAKIWHDTETEPEEWMEYTDPAIGAVPAGGFAIGSTGAGLYLIDFVEIDVLDE